MAAKIRRDRTATKKRQGTKLNAQALKVLAGLQGVHAPLALIHMVFAILVKYPDSCNQRLDSLETQG